MNDSETKERIVVYTEGMGGSYLMIPLDQLAVIESVLRENQIPYWVDSHSVSVDGKPAIIVINLGRGADVLRTQQLLDAID